MTPTRKIQTAFALSAALCLTASAHPHQKHNKSLNTQGAITIQPFNPQAFSLDLSQSWISTVSSDNFWIGNLVSTSPIYTPPVENATWIPGNLNYPPPYLDTVNADDATLYLWNQGANNYVGAGTIAETDITANGGTDWIGDFNYDGVINADFFSLYFLGLASAGSTTLPHTVPEPASLALILLPALLPRRRRTT